MKQSIALLLWAIFLAGRLCAQVPVCDCNITYRYTIGYDYVDYALRNDTLFGLTTTGLARAFSALTGEWLGRTDTLDTGTSGGLCMDAHQRLYAWGGQHIWRQQADGRWQLWQQFPNDTLLEMAFNSANELLLITHRGVLDVATGQKYFHKFEHSAIRNPNKWFEHPSTMMDHSDQLWFSFDFGEWGGDLFIFDTHKKAFVWNDATCMGSLSGMADAGDRYYVSNSSAHMMSTGTLYEIRQGGAELLFSSKMHRPAPAAKRALPELPPNPTKEQIQAAAEALRKQLIEAQLQLEEMFNGEYIGALAWSVAENRLYVNTGKGLFRMEPEGDFADMQQRDLLWLHKTCDLNGIVAFTMTGVKQGIFLNGYGALGLFSGNRIVLVR